LRLNFAVELNIAKIQIFRNNVGYEKDSPVCAK